MPVSPPPRRRSPPPRRSPLAQAALAVACLAIAIAFAVHHFAVPPVTAQFLGTDLFPEQTLGGVDAHSVVPGVGETHDVLFILPNVRITNPHPQPVLLDGAELTLIAADGVVTTTRMVTSATFARLEPAYPNLPVPLAHNATVPPGRSTQGKLLFVLNMPTSMWAMRQSASLKLSFDHAARLRSR